MTYFLSIYPTPFIENIILLISINLFTFTFVHQVRPCQGSHLKIQTRMNFRGCQSISNHLSIRCWPLHRAPDRYFPLQKASAPWHRFPRVKMVPKKESELLIEGQGFVPLTTSSTSREGKWANDSSSPIRDYYPWKLFVLVSRCLFLEIYRSVGDVLFNQNDFL